jgi:CRISPR/Cas system-associated protein Cas10 (large subunit of type III CRISPR-Cas system)
LDFKDCGWCGIAKPLDDFYRMSSGKQGVRPECKACTREYRRRWYAQNREREIARVHEWQRENADRVNARSAEYRKKPGRARAMRDLYYRRTFGLTADDVDQLIAKQNGCCAICGRSPQRLASLHLDHDHTTGQIRGVLCSTCNQGLGQFKEDPTLLEAAAAYLRRYSR